MTIPTYRSSRPAECVEPRPHVDASQRFATYGKVQPMDDESRPGRGRLFVIGVAFAVVLYFADRLLAGWWA